MYDVIVIGGGPVGSYVAYKLAGMGHRVAVVEQHAQPGEQVCCTGIISQECATSLVVDESTILRQANSARLFSPSGKLLRLWREEVQACIIDRAAFNRILASRAQDKGVEYLLNSLAKGIEVGSSSATIEVAYQGRELNLEGRVAVIATGFSSRLSERVGLGKVSDFAIGAQVEVEVSEVDEVEIYLGQGIAPGFFAWLVPTSSHRALVGLLARHNPGVYLKKLLSSLSSQGKIALTEAKPSYGGVPLKPLPRTYRGRLIVVGDAAGQVKPTTGGGIYYGLLCAEMAASTLHQALESNDLSIQAMADYERRWRGKLGRELEIGYYTRKFYEHLNDWQIDKIFDIMISNGIDEALLKARDLSFDWHSKALLRLMGNVTASTALKAMKIPFYHPRHAIYEPSDINR